MSFRPIRDLLTFCSGADRDALDNCLDNEKNKHRNIGAIILLTAIFASLSGGYALSTVFDHSTSYIQIPRNLSQLVSTSSSKETTEGTTEVPKTKSTAQTSITDKKLVELDSVQQSLKAYSRGLTHMPASNRSNYLTINLPFPINFLAIGFGLLWGVMIFSLDRYLVTSIKKKSPQEIQDVNKERKKNGKREYPDYLPDRRELLQALPRLFLAMVIAIVISKPLELKIFEKEIEQILLEKRNQLKLENQEQVGALYNSDLVRLQMEIDRLRSQVEDKETQNNALYQSYIAEAEGSGGTGLRGKGPIYQEKRAKYDQNFFRATRIKELKRLVDRPARNPNIEN